MHSITLKNVITISQRALNSADDSLLNHGEQVAYIMLHLLREHGGYTEEEIINICTISIFHDIGAYKTSKKAQPVEINSADPNKHAVYGSLFIKYFSPLGEFSNFILWHHLLAEHIKNLSAIDIPNEALLLGLADYATIINLDLGRIEEPYILSKEYSYFSENISLFIEANKKHNFTEKLNNGSFLKELYDFLDAKLVTFDEIISYARMLTYSIDFRSEATVRHTILVEAISFQLAKLCGLKDEELTRIKIAAVLHDIGKMSIPIEILEKPDKLTSDEFKIMKNHCIIGYNILSNLNIDDIRDISSYHHEKLDGSGYPFGLNAKDISTEARIIAISDIISALIGPRSYKDSFPKELTISILKEMVDDNKIDANLVALAIDNYDFIINEATLESSALITTYDKLMVNYNDLLKYIS
jgi:putative nucleotidyltransferase with HDIG domain